MVHYTCPRCGFVTEKASTYTNHTRRKRICKMLKDDVIPTTDNVIRGTAAQAAVVQNIVTNTTNNNTNTNTNTINIININIDSSTPRRRFPTQDLSHLTADQIHAILDTVTSAGFDEAIQGMIGTMYCDPTRPHNMNVIMEQMPSSAPSRAVDGPPSDTASEPRVVTKVYGMDRRAPTQWKEFDTVEALRIMLEEHAEAIRNFPDDLESVGGESVPQAVVDAVDEGYDAGVYKDNRMLHDTLTDKMTTSLRHIRELLRPYSDLLENAPKLSADDCPRPRPGRRRVAG